MQHLDEGTIHAWLDSALTADEAARVEQHASECAECAATVAEARGLVAGASRILSALDDLPAVVPAGARRVPETVGSSAHPSPAAAAARRRWWTRPAALAAAASVVLMAGSAIVLTRSGGQASLGTSMTENATTASAPTTEAAARLPVSGGTASAPAPAEGVAGNVPTRDGAGTAASARPVPLAPAPRASSAVSSQAQRRFESRATAAQPGRAPSAFGRDSTVPLAEVVTTGARRAADAVAQREGAVAEKAAPVAAPAPANASPDQGAVAGRAVARRAAASRMRGAAEPQRAAGVDTAYQGRGERAAQTDTVMVPGRVDTVIVEPPAPPGLRQPGRGAGLTARPFPVTGCYEVMEGGLPKSLTLTAKPAWSGAAEHRFVANAPGAVGYWSQPRSGDVHLVIAGMLVTARIDPTTGELRGTARRGRKSETFLARRCR